MAAVCVVRRVKAETRTVVEPANANSRGNQVKARPGPAGQAFHALMDGQGRRSSRRLARVAPLPGRSTKVGRWPPPPQPPESQRGVERSVEGPPPPPPP
ncbi:uncharacterized protein PSFLO_02325 [Pseudozyma flocculosa]|uniref:Uncharacterized protein n=1 Tax=Pseudozyma flocculosa TaxID=84751 RepID=A0A5C3EX98_9BASI|nr:uncharacterized protein PSFLO_02325 [Pseudozyma flocculosa]